MALVAAVAGGKRPSQTITWSDADGNALDLTGATITARIERSGTATASDGTFTITNATGGVFRWDYSSTDIGTQGRHRVQFTATFGSEPSPAISQYADWEVLEAI